MAQRALPRPKKAEYIELVYDLIFVYLIQRCEELLAMEPDGFFSGESFSEYLLSTLIVMQIWAFSTMYINRFGRNGIREYIFLIVNMFFLCFLASDTRENWEPFYVSYRVAWGCIIANLIVQYVRQLCSSGADVCLRRLLMRRSLVFLLQAAVILLSIPFSADMRMPFAWLALAVGYLAPAAVRRLDSEAPVSMEHLAERVMLFVVLSLGETLISAAEFFQGGFSAHTLYFAVCAFLVVIGMLLAYGFVYERILDRDRLGVGTVYMLLHVIIVVAVNDVTVGLEYMRTPDSDDFRTLLFLVVSLVIYYAMLLYIMRRSGRFYLTIPNIWRPFLIVSAVFAAAAFCFVNNRWVNAGLSAAYPYAVFVVLYASMLQQERTEPADDPAAPGRAS